MSPNTRRAGAGALHRLDSWLVDRGLQGDDSVLAAYLASLLDAGRTRCRQHGNRAARFLAGMPKPDGPARVLKS